MLGDTGNKRAVHILLECILLKANFCLEVCSEEVTLLSGYGNNWKLKIDPIENKAKPIHFRKIQIYYVQTSIVKDTDGTNLLKVVE